MHPASQSDLIEMSEVRLRPGMMWASLAASGSHGMARRAVWVDLSVAPLGRLILRGLLVGWTFVMRACGRRKWLVAPASAMARLALILMSDLLRIVSVCVESQKVLTGDD